MALTIKGRTALAYAIHNQRNQRNLTDAELLRCIEVVDQVGERGKGQKRDGGKFQPKASVEAYGKSAARTAVTVGVSRAPSSVPAPSSPTRKSPRKSRTRR
jgi:hypothetical protein